MKSEWMVVVGGGGIIAIGRCYAETREQAIEMAATDYEDDYQYWKQYGYPFDALPIAEYVRRDKDNEAWAAAMAG
jgi:hypothetical protein